MEQDHWAATLAAKSGSILCKFDAIEDATAQVFTLGNWRDGLEVIVARQAAQVFGYINVCAHMSLPLNIDSRVRTLNGLLLCDHHDAQFRFIDGLCIAGVCEGMSLVKVALGVRNGDVFIV